MTAVIDGFTRDVITLVGMRADGAKLIRDTMNNIERNGGDIEARAEFLKTTLLGVLAEDMVKVPPFVQQIVARALVDHVDWRAVAIRAGTNVEAN